MAGELRGRYEHLESQVQERTVDLREANALLERQRDKLEQLNADLAQETQFKSDLLSMVNHELRTPLTSIITFAQISREACDPANEHDRRSWEEIEKNSRILLNMINNMLDIARSDAGGTVSYTHLDVYKRQREGCFSLRPPRLPPAALRCGEPYSTWSVSVNVTVSTFFMAAYTFITIQYSTPAKMCIRDRICSGLEPMATYDELVKELGQEPYAIYAVEALSLIHIWFTR